MKEIGKSDKLRGVRYEIRGKVLEEANRLEEEGHYVRKLNIGNPTPYGLMAPDEVMQDVVRNLKKAQGYSESKGLFAARKAVVHDCQQKGIMGVGVEDVYLGNGVSELIVMALQALLNTGDELLVPAPDYPLWTAAVALSGGKPVHYRCAEERGWEPDLEDMRSKITPQTRGIVLINPNNPTGAVYSQALLQQVVELAREHELVLFSDEIYDKILYDGAVHVPLATQSADVLTITFGGLSKVYRAAGLRSGWMYLTGPKEHARGYIKGLDTLASMRLCANVPAMYGVQTALGGYQSIYGLTAPNGRLGMQRALAVEKLNAIPGVSCPAPQGAMYCFPRLDPNKIPIQDDERMALDLLRSKKILVVHGSSFNLADTQHFRITFLPHIDDLGPMLDDIGDFLTGYRQ